MNTTRKTHSRVEERNVTIIQPVIPHYRLDFFQRLADHFGDRFQVYASEIDMGALTSQTADRPWNSNLGPIKSIFKAFDWQVGISKVPLSRNDVLVLSGAARTLSNLLLIVRAKMKGVRIVWWGQYLSPTSSPVRLFLRTLLMRLADAILFYTDEEIAAYRQTKIGKKDRRIISSLNNGINVAPIAELRRQYDPAERDNAILFIGRLTVKSRFRLLIDALSDPKLSDVTLHVIGDGAHLDDFQKHANDRSVDHQIVWHGGQTDEGQISQIANRCKAFVYPGDIGLSLIHGLAYGLPCIVHSERSRHMPEIAAFDPNKNGVEFTRNDSSSMANAISELFGDNAKLQTCSISALKKLEFGHTTAGMASRFANLIQSMEV